MEKLLYTHRGPIVNEFKSGHETALSIRWMGNEKSNEIRSVYLLNRASNWNDFREAVSTFRSVSQNIVFADVTGNIGLQTSAGIPVRPGNGIQVYPDIHAMPTGPDQFPLKSSPMNTIRREVTSPQLTIKR